MLRPVLILLALSAAVRAEAAWLLPRGGNRPAGQQQPAPATNTAKPTQSRRAFEITGLTVRTQAQGIRLEWRNPEGVTNFGLSVYRHDAVLDAAEKLSPFRKVKDIPSAASVTSWTDTAVPDGTWFYAVTVTADGLENRTLTPEHAYNLVGVAFRRAPAVSQPRPATVAATQGPPAAAAPALPQALPFLRAEAMGDSVLLSWPTPPNGVRVRLYRDRAPILSVSNRTAVVETRNSYLDMLAESGDYYYAATTVSEAGENRSLTPGRNTLQQPVRVVVRTPPPQTRATQTARPAPVVAKATQAAQAAPVVAKVTQAPRPAPVATKATQAAQAVRTAPEGRFEAAYWEIRRRHYDRGDYATAARRLAAMAADPACPPRWADEARLLQAKALYHLKRHREALRILVRVRSVFPEEADFWIGRIVSEL